MVALRAVMRLGWEAANPINAFNADNATAFPFSVYTPPEPVEPEQSDAGESDAGE